MVFCYPWVPLHFVCVCSSCSRKYVLKKREATPWFFNYGFIRVLKIVWCFISLCVSVCVHHLSLYYLWIFLIVWGNNDRLVLYFYIITLLFNKFECFEYFVLTFYLYCGMQHGCMREVQPQGLAFREEKKFLFAFVL